MNKTSHKTKGKSEGNNRNNNNLEKTMYKLHKKYRQKTNEKRPPDLTNGLRAGKIRPAQRNQQTLQRLKIIWMK